MTIISGQQAFINYLKYNFRYISSFFPYFAFRMKSRTRS